MADRILETQSDLLFRWRDMGDGTHAKVVVAALGQPIVARQLAAGTTSASVALTASCTRVSICARTSDLRYTFGTAAVQTASAGTSHFIAAGERLDLWVPAGTTFAAIRASHASADGVLEISELQ